MRVVDTSAWIEWLSDTEVGARVEPQLPAQEQWLVPTIVLLELAKWLGRTVSGGVGDQVIAFSSVRRVISLSSEIALSAAELAMRHKLATADAIVYATALACEADLLTCDRHFEGLPFVELIPKA